MPLTPSQEGRALRIDCPSLGTDVLVPTALRGEEALSRPFVFTIDFVSTRTDVPVKDVLGKPMVVRIILEEDAERTVNGIVRRFTRTGQDLQFTYWRAEVVPALWHLALATDCRTFEEESVPDIVTTLLRAESVDVRRKITTAPPALPYVVQYRETNLDFMTRLLAEAGLYYTFQFDGDRHAVVLSDAHAGTVPAGDPASLPVLEVKVDGQPPLGVVSLLTRDVAMHAQKVALTDHHLLRADDPGQAESRRPGARGERFDYLGDLGPTASRAEARRRIEIEEAGHEVLRGESSCVSLQAGTRVRLTRASGGADEVHVLRVVHTLTLGNVLGSESHTATYHNAFDAIPAAVPYRPERPTPRPSVRGTHVARVVGTGGEGAIDVDEHGCVLLQFPWDRGKGKDGGSKHRVHVASAWAGAQWGFVQLPRVGQEVLVEFLDGDPARPIVTGRVYTSANKPPYALAANKTQSGWKSRTLGGGADNFNELRFDDKKGEEHVSLQAERDLEALVKNDETRTVKHDRTTTITNHDTRTVEEGDDVHTVKQGKQVVEVSQGDQTVTVKQGNQTVEVSQGDQEITVAVGKQQVTVNGDQTLVVKTGDRSASVDTGNDQLTVKVGNLTIGVKLGNVSIKADVGSITLEALQGITLKCGPTTSVKLTPAGVEVKGAMTTIEATAQAQLKGAMVTVQGQAMTQVKAPMVQVNGDALLMAKGGITMIG